MIPLGTSLIIYNDSKTRVGGHTQGHYKGVRGPQMAPTNLKEIIMEDILWNVLVFCFKAVIVICVLCAIFDTDSDNTWTKDGPGSYYHESQKKQWQTRKMDN